MGTKDGSDAIAPRHNWDDRPMYGELGVALHDPPLQLTPATHKLLGLLLRRVALLGLRRRDGRNGIPAVPVSR